MDLRVKPGDDGGGCGDDGGGREFDGRRGRADGRGGVPGGRRGGGVGGGSVCGGDERAGAEGGRGEACCLVRVGWGGGVLPRLLRHGGEAQGEHAGAGVNLAGFGVALRRHGAAVHR